MLDQNTDRMWYVIGAVIVGAAIIFLANGTLPSIFASVTDSFDEQATSAQDSIEMRYPPLVDLSALIDGQTPSFVRLLEQRDMSTRGLSNVTYDATTRTYSMQIRVMDGWSQGFHIQPSANLVVPYDAVYLLEYDVRPPIDMYARNDVNNSIVKPNGTYDYVNDGDDQINRQGHFTNGRDVTLLALDRPETFAPANEWTTIRTLYRNKNNISRNPEQLPLLDSTIFGLHNDTNGTVDVQMRHIRVSIFEMGGD